MLLKRGQNYYCRVCVPLDLQARLGRKELKKSLHTAGKKEAKMVAAMLESKVAATFFKLRCGLMNDRELEQLTVSILAEFTGWIEEHRKGRKTADEFLFLPPYLPIGLDANFDLETINTTFQFPRTADAIQAAVAEYQKRIKSLEEQRATGLYHEDTRRLVSRLVEERKLEVELPPAGWFHPDLNAWWKAPPADFARVCDSIIDGLIQGYNVEMGRIQGRRDVATEAVITARIEAAKPRPKLFDLWEGYKAHKLATNKWNTRTLEKYEGYYGDALRILGNRELTDYRQDDAIKLLETLRKGGNSPGTITGKVEFVSSMFRHALKTPESQERWMVKGNPFVEMQVQDTGSDEPDKIPYTQDDLTNLLKGLLSIRKLVEPHRFWVPLVALYTGMRQSEVCQLRTADIEDEGKSTVLRIRHRPELQQKTKNKRSRTCPVHPELQRLGFLKFVEKQRAAGHDRLFHTLTHSATKDWTGKVRTWWNTTFQAVLADTTGKSFHSFRKCFINQFKQSGAYETANDRMIMQSMVGHDGADDVTADHYEGNFPAETQYNLLVKLDYGFPPELLGALRSKEY